MTVGYRCLLEYYMQAGIARPYMADIDAENEVLDLQYDICPGI